MVGKIIRDYMEGGAKKLTVPGFGTFMRREGGEVIFVDLLRGDDKVLSEMVEDSGGHSEVEAMALIDRFIFKTKTAIERNGSATIEGFGVMTLDHKGLYQFRYSPKARPVKEHAVQERLFEQEPAGPARPVQSRPAVQAVRTPAPRTAAAPRQPGHTPPARKPAPQPQRTQNRPAARKPGRGTSRRPQEKLSRTDTFLIIAIVAAVIALAVMIFGLTSASMPFLSN